MVFEGKVIKEESFDPFFKIEFSFITDSLSIKRGYATVKRQTPKPFITFDPKTEERLNDIDRERLEFELLNQVIDYILKNCANRSWRGNVILRTA
ncbi:MAG: hypothetical protein N2645_08665 [Clostridia bacterium]|nr:hypothetical protein [Clostridia bacterium]